ncbi:MFS transporter [Gordonia effusa]|nr:MFS transporter [Gordonia effusa]
MATIRQESNNLTIAQLLTLSIGTFTLGIDGFVLAGLLPDVASDLHVSQATAGQLTTVFAIVYAVGSPLIATVTGSWDRRRLLAGGMAIFVVGMLFQALGPVYVTVLIGRILAAIGAAAFQANAFAVAGLLSSEKERPRSLAFVATGTSLALVVGLPFGVLLGQWLGWRGVMWALVVLAVISGAFVATLPAAHTPATSLRTRLTVLGRGPVVALLIGTCLSLIPAYLVLSYAPNVLRGSGTIVIVGMLAFGAGQVAGTRVVPRIITSRSALVAMIVGSTGGCAALVVLSVAQHWSWAAAIVFAAVGFFAGLSIVPQQNRFFSIAPDVAPVALGLNGSATYAGSAIGAAAGGAILGTASATWIPPIAAGVALISAVYLYLSAPEKRVSSPAARVSVA